MRRLWRVLFLLAVSCGLSASLQAQGGFTTVTGTITGPIDGIVWSCGTISAQLVTAGGVSPTLNGGGFSTSTSPIALGCPTTNGLPAGSFSMRLADSGVIVPGTTTWQFTVSMAPGIAPPAGTGAQSFTYTTAINCSTNTPSTCTANTMSISAQLSALAPKLSNASGGTGTGFPVTTSVAVNSGGTITVNTGGSIGTSGTGTITATNGTGASASPAAPITHSVLSNTCPTSNTGQCWFSFLNTQVDQTATWSSGTNVITITDSKFTAADVATPAKYLWGFGATVNANNHGGCDPYQSMPVGANLTLTHLTITGFTDANHVTVSANPGTTWSTTGGCIIWGQTDDAGAAAMDTAMQAQSSCARGEIGGGYLIFTTFHWVTQPAACLNHPNVWNSTQFGNVYFASGFELHGQGVAATTFFQPPDFPESGTCNNGPGANACWFVPGEGHFHDFGLNGGGGNLGPVGATAIMEVGVGSLEYFTCTNIGNSGTSSFGVEIWNQAQLQQVNVNNCGANGFHITASTGTQFSGSPLPLARGYRLSSDNSQGANYKIDAGANFGCHTCFGFGTQNTSGVNIFANAGGTLWLYDSDATQVAANVTVAGISAYNCTAGTCVLYLDHSRLGVGSVATITNGITCSVTCTNYINASILNGTGSGSPYADGVSTSFLVDGCLNKFTGTAANVTGTVNGSCSITGTQLVTGNVVLTSGWGTGAAASAFSGSSGSESWTTTIGTTPATTAVTTVTFPVPFLPGSKVGCSATLSNGSSTAILQTQCVATPTTATITYLGTLVSGTVITRLTASN